jgi:hypothetical protein
MDRSEDRPASAAGSVALAQPVPSVRADGCSTGCSTMFRARASNGNHGNPPDPRRMFRLFRQHPRLPGTTEGQRCPGARVGAVPRARRTHGAGGHRPGPRRRSVRVLPCFAGRYVLEVKAFVRNTGQCSGCSVSGRRSAQAADRPVRCEPLLRVGPGAKSIELRDRRRGPTGVDRSSGRLPPRSAPDDDDVGPAAVAVSS